MDELLVEVIEAWPGLDTITRVRIFWLRFWGMHKAIYFPAVSGLMAVTMAGFFIAFRNVFLAIIAGTLAGGYAVLLKPFPTR